MPAGVSLRPRKHGTQTGKKTKTRTRIVREIDNSKRSLKKAVERNDGQKLKRRLFRKRKQKDV